jgi:hypothetical protein
VLPHATFEEDNQGAVMNTLKNLPIVLSISLLATACPPTRHGNASPTLPKQVVASARGGKPLQINCRHRSGRQPSAHGLIRSANVNIRTVHPGAALHHVSTEAQKRGGYIAQARQHSNNASLTVRVPASQLEEALCLLARLGEVQQLRINSRDVRSQLDVVNARLQQLTRIYRAQGDNAEEASFAQWVISQLQSARQEKQRLDDQIALATIQVALQAR